VFLERAVGGAALFEPFLRSYISRFQYGAITSADLQDAFNDAFDPEKSGVVTAPDGSKTSIDWQTWLHAPGMPPVDLSAGCAPPAHVSNPLAASEARR
jgi:leukotriene-A4 hydrolase